MPPPTCPLCSSSNCPASSSRIILAGKRPLLFISVGLLWLLASKLVTKNFSLVLIFLLGCGFFLRWSYALVPALLGKILLLVAMCLIAIDLNKPANNINKYFLCLLIVFTVLLFTHRLYAIMGFAIIFPFLYFRNRKLGLVSWIVMVFGLNSFLYFFRVPTFTFTTTIIYWVLEIGLLVCILLADKYKTILNSLVTNLLAIYKHYWRPLLLVIIGGWFALIFLVSNLYAIPFSIAVLGYALWSLFLLIFIHLGLANITSISYTKQIFILWLFFLGGSMAFLGIVLPSNILHGVRATNSALILLFPIIFFGLIIFIKKIVTKNKILSFAILSLLLSILFISSAYYAFFPEEIANFDQYQSKQDYFLFNTIKETRVDYLATPRMINAQRGQHSYWNLYLAKLPVKELYKIKELNSMINNKTVPFPQFGQGYPDTENKIVRVGIIFQRGQLEGSTARSDLYDFLVENSLVDKTIRIGMTSIFTIQEKKVVKST